MAMRAPDHPDEVEATAQLLEAAASRRVRGSDPDDDDDDEAGDGSTGSVGSGDAGFGTVLDMLPPEG
ncbi:hypothetical protein GCM10009721_08020 [Terrabacter tumescens]|uniref:Uncharacterized protein n=1 Tax=Terrabacter tumescens TaxID=60443 RepID=A0ABQ2HQV8_9MICO|nr:hypothetical protein [Terrabacter tumescens]GGM85771.1 hypothetical protein GCM10009721_08020 [Terrabacter tumescens]